MTHTLTDEAYSELCLKASKCEDVIEVLQEIRQEIVDEQSGWIKGSDPEWHECRRILGIIDNHIEKYKE